MSAGRVAAFLAPSTVPVEEDGLGAPGEGLAGLAALSCLPGTAAPVFPSAA